MKGECNFALAFFIVGRSYLNGWLVADTSLNALDSRLCGVFRIFLSTCEGAFQQRRTESLLDSKDQKGRSSEESTP